jgi:hypothetical protein
MEEKSPQSRCPKRVETIKHSLDPWKQGKEVCWTPSATIMEVPIAKYSPK